MQIINIVLLGRLIKKDLKGLRLAWENMDLKLKFLFCIDF